MRRAGDGSLRWLGWASPLWPVLLWHALADGTALCWCVHSCEFHEIARRS